MNTTEQDIAFIAPEALPFTDGDDLAVVIGPANVGQCFQALRVARVLVDEVLAMPPEMQQRMQLGQPTPEDVAWLYELVCERGALAFDLVAALTGIPAARVALLLPDRFAYLFALVVTVNADFFGQARRTFQRAGQQLRTAAQRAGWTTSSTA